MRLHKKREQAVHNLPACLAVPGPEGEREEIMVCEVRFKNKEFKKYTKAVWVGILGSSKDKLYIQTRNRGCVVETFIPLSDIDCWNVREPVN